uniref:Uncharacterized protein n=1 Tax=Physcomitrium patens TaxID=3218 RepID=A0A2K1J2W9_PHYPA|nr:hypothetical protein PHYPA_021720 [Physcomitrium patens]
MLTLVLLFFFFVLLSIFVQFLRPVMTRFTIAFREISTYKDVLRSQVQQSCYGDRF